MASVPTDNTMCFCRQCCAQDNVVFGIAGDRTRQLEGHDHRAEGFELVGDHLRRPPCRGEIPREFVTGEDGSEPLEHQPTDAEFEGPLGRGSDESFRRAIVDDPGDKDVEIDNHPRSHGESSRHAPPASSTSAAAARTSSSMTSSGSRGRSIARCRFMPSRKSRRAASRLSLAMRKSMKSTAAATPCGESFRNRSWSRPSDEAPRCGSAPDGGRRIGS